MKPKPKRKPWRQQVEWEPGTVVRGIFIGPPENPDDRYGFVATLDGTIQEFSIEPPSLARQLEGAPSGALVSITYAGRDVFRVQWKPYGVWQSITIKQLTIKRPDGSIKVIQRPPREAVLIGTRIDLSALTSRTMSMGARMERLLSARLVELERLLDSPTPELWAEYYRVCDLWLRARAPVTSNPPITKAQLTERFAKPR